MDLHIDANSAEPPFEQVRLYLLTAIRSGGLPAGTKLPTVRAFALELGLAANTVARAYRDLERDQLIETRGRLGSFVAFDGDDEHKAAHQAAIEFAERMAKLGIDEDEAVRIARTALRATL